MSDKCSARALFDSWNLTDKHAADDVCLRKPSCKSTRQTKKLESSLQDKCGVRDTGLLLEISTLAPEDCAADVVRLRKPSRKSSRHSLKLESSLHDKHGFERFSDKALQMDAMATFHNTHATPCMRPATDGNRHGNFNEGWLSDNLSDVSIRPSSSAEALLCACSPVSQRLDDQTMVCSKCFPAGF